MRSVVADLPIHALEVAVTDEAQFNQSPTTPGSLSPWTRRRVNAIYLAAYIVLGLAGVAVMAGSIWVANTMIETLPVAWNPDLDPEFRPVPVTGILTMLFWGSLVMTSARMQPKDEDVTDYGEVRIVSSAMHLVGCGIVLLAGLACVSVAKNAGVHPSAALLGLLAMAFGFPVINMIVGPKVRRRAPEIWAEALARSADVVKASAERAKKPIPTRNKIVGLIGLGIGMLVFFLSTLLATF